MERNPNAGCMEQRDNLSESASYAQRGGRS